MNAHDMGKMGKVLVVISVFKWAMMNNDLYLYIQYIIDTTLIFYNYIYNRLAMLVTKMSNDWTDIRHDWFDR